MTEWERIIEDSLPDLNPVICEGVAYHSSKDTMPKMDQMLRALSEDFVEGLRYDGLRKCTIEEEVRFITRERDKECKFDSSKSFYYAAEFLSSLHGKKLAPRIIMLPFTTRGNKHYIQGTRYTVTTMMDDAPIAPGSDSVFVKLLKAKITFLRLVNYAMEDGKVVSNKPIYAAMHRGISNRTRIKASTTMVHYLLCQYGFTGMFEKYKLPVPKIVIGNEEEYPSEDWVILSSHGLLRRKGDVFAGQISEIKLAILREDYDQLMKGFLAGFFYVLDHFPDRIEPEYLDHKGLWRRLLGVLIFDQSRSEGEMEEGVNTHMRFLEEYLDDFSKIRLHRVDVNVNSIFDLFVYVIQNFNKLVSESSEYEASMYGKTVQAVESLLEPLTKAFNLTHYEVTNRQRTRTKLSQQDIESLFQEGVTPRCLFSNSSGQPILTATGSSGDNMAFKTTVQLIYNGSRSSKKTGGFANDPTRRLNESILEVGQIGGITESDPDGRGRLNPFLQIDLDTGAIIRNENLRKAIDKVKENISR